MIYVGRTGKAMDDAQLDAVQALVHSLVHSPGATIEYLVDMAVWHIMQARHHSRMGPTQMPGKPRRSAVAWPHSRRRQVSHSVGLRT